MVQYEELRLHLEELEPGIRDLKEALGISLLLPELEKLEKQSADPNFWDDMQASQKVLQRISAIKNKIAIHENLCREYDDAHTLIELADEEEDLSLLDEAKEAVAKVENELETQKLATLLSGEYDQNNAILTFHAGAGGTEAQDWAMMLYRMYTRWAERHGFKYKILDYLDGEEAGIKSASILVEGENAYGYLKCEVGVHRLVRVSPFDASGRRHTSFASLEVMPEISDDIDIEIRDEDLKVDTYRSSGAGGQKVNKTESAVRITHIPTGIVVSCQVERSQHQNRAVCMTMLKSKLIEIKEREHLERIEDIKGVQKEIAWGSQIRSYVFMPYTLVKDHRTGFESGNIGAVMDGDLDGFINAYLKAQSVGQLGENIE
ncbi:peptide chain release factor 2 [Solibaculum mannosilyticum]|uniref:Peptide chain release factor 2 n=1 Tax=Solibaculum mannosilyticum TaxID=2780922 RepID=A0A7I8CZP2_9FIRM|nr:peptide chain release factor 2 [Solibaculum mannosilyticum]MCO7137270.1 peptide chain release factor 2 [[Clostridium] leptum]BCI59906.1 peptide chain release factor 2 [Solibaculum mannosilyticum]CZT56619.1 Peptide chain release factor 2 [Eubacteriaceae bacterium CHKCI005]